MPRRPRITIPDTPHHIIQRGNNRQPCFYREADYRCYLDWLSTYAKETDCSVHAYVLMTNHVHLLVTPHDRDSLGQLMKKLGQRFVQYINRTQHRSGTLWEGRYRSSIAGEEKYILACYRYIELNPVRAGMVFHPSQYPWSSYQANAEGKRNELLTATSAYNSLATTLTKRLSAYRELFLNQFDPSLIDEIRNSTNGNYALGSTQFQNYIEQATGKRAKPGKSGRPLVT